MQEEGQIPLLKEVLSEGATDNVEDKLWHSLTCEGRTSTLHHEEELSSNCRQMITRQVTNTFAGFWNAACTARATPHKIERKSLHRHTRGIACSCAWRGCIKGEHIVAILHGDDITVGGEGSVVEFLI